MKQIGTNRRRAGWAAALAGWALVVVSQGDRVVGLLANTAWVSLTAAAFAVAIGTFLALVWTRTDLPGRGAWRFCWLLLLLMPLYLHAAGWEAGFGRQGWHSYSHGSLTSPLLQGWWAVVWIHSLAAAPWAALVVARGLDAVPPELEEQASLDAPPLQVLIGVTLPLALPAIATAFVWVALAVAGEMTVSDMYQVRTYAEELYTAFALGADTGLTAGQQTILNLCVLGAWGVGALALAHRLAPWGGPTYGRPTERMTHGWAARWGMVLGLTYLFVALAAPLGNLIYNAGLEVTLTDGVRRRSWAWAKFAAILVETPRRYAAEFGWSAAIGATAASIALAAATPLAWWARDANWRKLALWATAAAALAIPGPALGLLLIELMNRESPAWLAFLYDRTLAAPALATAVRAWPLVALVVGHAFQSLPREQLESAALEGAGSTTQLWRVALPQRRAALAAAWLVGFVWAVGDLTASVVVLPPGKPTLAFSVFQLAHAGVDDRLAGLCLTSVGAFATLAAVVARLLGKTATIVARRDGRTDEAESGESFR